MYGQTNQTNMPDYLHNYDLWDQYMGTLWQGLIARTPIQPDSTLIEVAPGATSKIATALSQMNFSGRLFIIEPHPTVSQLILQKSRALLPRAQVVLLKQNFNAIRLDEPIDGILANHVFDDLISAYAVRDQHTLGILFQDIANESEAALAILKQTWHLLSENVTLLATLKSQIHSDWLGFTEHHNPKTVILSQYTSSYFEKHHLSIINTHAQELFRMIGETTHNPLPCAEVQTILNRNENYGNPWISHELLNAESWLIDER